jgi:hypothetical protein
LRPGSGARPGPAGGRAAYELDRRAARLPGRITEFKLDSNREHRDAHWQASHSGWQAPGPQGLYVSAESPRPFKLAGAVTVTVTVQ